jgi:16S rRNA (cytosine967-C5)-methyltransferase
LNKKENEKQVQWFLKEYPNFTLESEKTIFPFDYDSDGFYIAKLIKSAN